MRSIFQSSILILCLTLACLATASAQERSYNFDAYSVDNGLSQNSIASIIQGPEGFLWISTFDGVNRFDGYVFNEFRTNPAQERPEKTNERVVYNSAAQMGRAVVKSFGLHGSRNHLFYLDQQFRLFVAHNAGISLYDSYKGSFRLVFADSIYINEAERDFLPKFKILGEDPATQTLWVWRPAKGLYQLDSKTYELKKIILYPPNYARGNKLPHAVVMQDNYIWICFENEQLYRMDIHTARLTTFCMPTLSGKPAIRALNNDSLLVVSNGHITIFDTKRNRYSDTKFSIFNELQEPFLPSVIELDERGNAWIGGTTACWFTVSPTMRSLTTLPASTHLKLILSTRLRHCTATGATICGSVRTATA